LRGCEVHITHIPTPGDETGLHKLGVNLTCDPSFAGKDLFVGWRGRGAALPRAAADILSHDFFHQEHHRYQEVAEPVRYHGQR